MDVLERFSAERAVKQADEGSRHLFVVKVFWKRSEAADKQTEIRWEREEVGWNIY